jgi:opacity protein-like surface antigen
MKLWTAAFVAGLLLISTHANAQVTPGKQQAAISLGWSNPLSHDSVDSQDEAFGEFGPAFGFNYLYQVQRYLSLGGDFNFKRLGGKDITTGHGPAEIKSTAWTLLAIGRADLMPDNDVRPYGLMGLGIGGLKREVEFSQRPDLDSSQNSTGVAFALGAGVDVDINAAWLAGAELRYNIIGTRESDIGSGSVSTLDILFKVGYKF